MIARRALRRRYRTEKVGVWSETLNRRGGPTRVHLFLFIYVRKAQKCRQVSPHRAKRDAEITNHKHQI